MEQLLIDRWLAAQFGLPPWFVVAFILPVLIYLLAFLLREILLRIVLLRESRPERVKLWRRISFYATILVGILAVGVYWRAASLDWLYAELQREFQSPELKAYLRGTIYAVVATAVLLFTLVLIAKGYRFLRRRVGTWVAGGETVIFQKAALGSRRRLGHTIRLGLKVVGWSAVLVVFNLYIPFVLSCFPPTAPYAGRMAPYVTGPITRAAVAVVAYLPSLLTLIVILIVARYVLRLLRTATTAIEKGQITFRGFDPEWGEPTFRLARIVVILLTIIVTYPYLPGSGSAIFQGFSIFIGATVTLGASVAINNIISGVVLTYTRSFRVGDRVRIGDVLGDIIEKGLFVTRVQAWGDEAITIPNGKVLASDVVNLTAAAHDKGLSIFVPAGIGYDTDWRQVHELMKGAALETEGLESDPEPFVIQTALDSYAVSYLLVAKTMEPKRQRLIESALRENVLDAFNGAGIEIMTPSVTAVRDANHPAIPATYNPQPFRFPGLRMLSVEPKG